MVTFGHLLDVRNHSFSKFAIFSEKPNVSYPLIHTCTCAYQRIRNVRSPENFANELNEWSLMNFIDEVYTWHVYGNTIIISQVSSSKVNYFYITRWNWNYHTVNSWWSIAIWQYSLCNITLKIYLKFTGVIQCVFPKIVMSVKSSPNSSSPNLELVFCSYLNWAYSFFSVFARPYAAT